MEEEAREELKKNGFQSSLDEVKREGDNVTRGSSELKRIGFNIHKLTSTSTTASTNESTIHVHTPDSAILNILHVSELDDLNGNSQSLHIN